jgi:hypothetical protein
VALEVVSVFVAETFSVFAVAFFADLEVFVIFFKSTSPTLFKIAKPSPSNLNVFVFGDFLLEGNWGPQGAIPYELRSSEFGDFNILGNGDIVATFQYNNVISKILSLQLVPIGGAPMYCGNYSDIITFTIEYEEVAED